MCLGHGRSLEPIHLVSDKAAPEPITQNKPVKEYLSPSHPRGSELERSSQGITSH